MVTTAVLFIEFPDLQLHYDPMFDSLYITVTCRFRLYFFFHRDFAVPLFHSLFDPTTPYIAIALQVAHPGSPPVAPVATPLTSPPQMVLSLSLGDGSNSSKVADSSPSSSSGSSANYIPMEPCMANGFLSPEPM